MMENSLHISINNISVNPSSEVPKKSNVHACNGVFSLKIGYAF